MDPLLILIGQTVGDDAAHDALVLSVLTALVAALEVVLLQGEPRRAFCVDDAPRLQADVHLVREYFCARDAAGVPHALPEALVQSECQALEKLVTIMGQSSEALVAEVFGASRFGPDGRRLESLAEWSDTDPHNRINLVGVLMARAKLDPIAARFVEQHRDALRELLQRGLAKVVRGGRHGRGIRGLREEIEGRMEVAVAREREAAERAAVTVRVDDPPAVMA